MNIRLLYFGRGASCLSDVTFRSYSPWSAFRISKMALNLPRSRNARRAQQLKPSAIKLVTDLSAYRGKCTTRPLLQGAGKSGAMLLMRLDYLFSRN